MSKQKGTGFTLIELLVVISIIGLLSTLSVVAFQDARAKARDSVRKGDLAQMMRALELRFNDTRDYPVSAGWFSNPGHGGLDAALIPIYMPRVPDDPLNSGSNIYMYYRKDFVQGCLTGGRPLKYAFYAKLEKPSANDLATIQDDFDICVKNTWGMNFRTGGD